MWVFNITIKYICRRDQYFKWSFSISNFFWFLKFIKINQHLIGINSITTSIHTCSRYGLQEKSPPNPAFISGVVAEHRCVNKKTYVSWYLSPRFAGILFLTQRYCSNSLTATKVSLLNIPAIQSSQLLWVSHNIFYDKL